MTQEEIEIGQQWVGILAKYQSDFASKSLFTATSAFLQKGTKVKKFGLSAPSSVLVTKEPSVEELKKISLMEAAKKRHQMEEEPTNLLATSEDDFNPKKYKTKKNV
jgi:hypothetical protein